MKKPLHEMSLHDQRGASAVEFAFIVPLLVVLVLGIVEFGHAFQVQGTLSAAAREGVRAMALRNDPADARAVVRDAAASLDPGVTDAQITIAPESCEQTPAGNRTVTVTIRYPKPLLTGFFGASLNLTGTGVMRCNG